ncbi:MAG: hypothetical protein LBU51_07390, partial [Bacteroidales bacterium]|nr:hypothetical protein [Bacteroidales bacterium]
NWKEFEQVLNRQEIFIDYKHKGQTNEIQGISFRKGEQCFKGSEIDRSFSYPKLNAILNGNRQEEQIQVQSKESMTSGFSDLVSGLGTLFDISPAGSDYDPDEAQLLKQHQPKKKKKRGFRL